MRPTVTHATPRSCSPRAAFTLMEVVLALGIGLIIFFVAAATVKQTAGVSSRANAALEQMNTSRSALDALEEDLAGAFLQADGSLFRCGDAEPRGATQLDMLAFRTVPPAAYDLGGQPSVSSQVFYYVNADSDLVRYDFPPDSDVSSIALLAAGGFAGQDSKVLLRAVENFQVRFYNPFQPAQVDPWRTSWDSTVAPSGPPPWAAADVALSHQYRRLPAFVHVTIDVLYTPDLKVDSKRTVRDLHPPLRIERVMTVGTRAPAQ